MGSITWRDLTVPNAEVVRDFYQAVVGWTSEPVDMGDYEDYQMFASGSSGDGTGGAGERECVAGVCHARGTNANVPSQWLIYITVPDVDAAARKAIELGGKILDGPRPMGGGRFAVIQDPAGAAAAVYAAR